MTALEAAGARMLSVSTETILERAAHENFPVALRCLPSGERRHLLAVYGFARLADHLGDDAPGDRWSLLDELERDLDRAYAGTPRHPVLQRLAASVRERSLPREPFAKLIEANRRDQCVKRYASYEQLLEYCALSANPVGLLVLHIFGKATPERETLSDSVCTALQLVEHCQDVAEDLRRGRIYLPAEDLERYGCSEADLRQPHADAALRAVIGFQLNRVRRLLGKGSALLETLDGWSWLSVLGFIAGGHAAADACDRVGLDVLPGAPRTRRRDVLRHAALLALRRQGRSTVRS